MKILKDKQYRFEIGSKTVFFAILLVIHISLLAQNEGLLKIEWMKKMPIPSGKLIFESLTLNDSLIHIKVRQNQHTLLLQTNLYFDTLKSVETQEKRLENEIWSGHVGNTFLQILHRNAFGNADKLLMRTGKTDTAYQLAEFNCDPVKSIQFFAKVVKDQLFFALQPAGRHFHDSVKILYWLVSILDTAAGLNMVHSTFSLNYDEKLTEAIDIFFVQGQIKMLHKVFNKSPIEQRHFQPNYSFHLNTYNVNSGLVSLQKLPFRPETYYLRTRCFTKEKIIMATYGNSKLNKAQGYYLYNYDQSSAANWDSVHLPFGKNIIDECRLSSVQKPKSVVALHPDLLWKDDSGNYFLIGEQYYNKRVGSSGMTTIYSFHYGAVLISKYSPDFKLLHASVIRKKQKSYNDMGQQLSYHIVFKNGEPVIIFNQHKKYLQHNNIRFNNGRKPEIYYSVLNEKRIWVPLKVQQTSDYPLAIYPHLITRISADKYLVVASRKRNLYLGYLFVTKQP